MPTETLAALESEDGRSLARRDDERRFQRRIAGGPPTAPWLPAVRARTINIMETLSEAIESLVRRGFTEHFGVRGASVTGHSGRRLS